MKQIIIPICIMISSMVSAQMPHAFKYQALARDHDFEVLDNHPVSLKASIMAGGPNGTEVYRELHHVTTSQSGLFSLAIGQGIVQSGTFAGIPWANGAFYLKIEIDVEGNGIYEYAGTSPLLAVPYAMHAFSAENVDDADADPANEIQTLDFNPQNSTISISGGNTVVIPTGGSDGDGDPQNEIQILSRSGNKITLSNGGEVEDQVEDDDADPTNEIQELVYDSNNKKLRITGGNEIQFNHTGDADADPRNELQELRITRQNEIEAPYRISLSQGNSIDLPLTSLWRHSIQNGNLSQIYTSVPVITKRFTAEALDVTVVPAHWDHPRITQTEYQFRTASGTTGMRMSKNRLAHHYGSGGSKYTMFLDDNSLRFYNRSEYVTAEFGGDKAGLIKLYTGGSTSPYFTVEKTNSNRSQLRMYSAQTRQFIFGVNESSLGGSAASLYGSKSVNVSMGSSGNADHGGLHVHDSKSMGQAGVYVDAQGRGVLYADIKNFVADHPVDPGKEIVYASVEGPEAAIYERGTARMIDGKATISFSEHFSLMLDDSRMTVMLTPLSAESKGLAVIEKTNSGFTVQELQGGQGRYSFDWEVKAIRKGFEHFQVIRPKTN